MLYTVLKLPISAFYKVHKQGQKIIMLPTKYPDPDSTYDEPELF
jgi:hypothetical protein